MSAKTPGWQKRLAHCVAEAAARPFAYGRHDCALFAADAVAAMTGSDPMAGFRGRYRSLKSGLKAVRAAGFADHLAVFSALFAELPQAYAQAGDLAALDGDDGWPALGVVQGEMIWVLRPDGLVALTAARRAWWV